MASILTAAMQPQLGDETEGFLRSGIITIMDNRGFAQKQLFGEEYYWIRIIDESDFYSGQTVVLPSILSFNMNVTEIINVDTSSRELFTMEIYQENMNFKLLHSHIIEISLYINEIAGLDEEELRLLKAAKAVRCVYDEAGLLEQWVRWEGWMIFEFLCTDVIISSTGRGL